MGSSNNTIALKFKGHKSEATVVGIFSPGHMIMKDSAGKLKKHNVLGGAGEKMFALEDSLQGRTINIAYAVDELAFTGTCVPGDVVNGRIPVGAVAIVIGDLLMSDGAGGLIKATGVTDSLYANTAASAAISNTVAETAFDKSYTIPANTLAVGDIIRVRVQVIATSTNSTDTLTLKLKIGTTVIIATAAVDVANNDIGYIEADLIIRTIGASGTFVATGNQGLGTPGTVTAKPFNLASTAIDTTATQAITVTATWSVASASNSCRLDILTVDRDRTTGAGEGVLFVAEEAVDNSAGSADVFCAVKSL